MFALFEIVKTRFYVVTILSKLNYILEMQWEFFFISIVKQWFYTHY